MGSSAELGRRVMGGVGAMGTREREEESVRFMALFHYDRMAQTRASDGREITRDHVKKNLSQAARNSWTDVDRETVASQAFASGRQGPEGAPLQKPSADLVGLAMVRGGDHLDIVFNRNRLVVAIEGGDRAGTLPVRRTPILECTLLLSLAPQTSACMERSADSWSDLRHPAERNSCGAFATACALRGQDITARLRPTRLLNREHCRILTIRGLQGAGAQSMA